MPYNIPFVITRILFGKEKKIRGNKYDAPFMSMDRETARKIANQSSPAKKEESEKTVIDEANDNLTSEWLISGDENYHDKVLEIAKQEVAIMSEEDKEYYLNIRIMTSIILNMECI